MDHNLYKINQEINNEIEKIIQHEKTEELLDSFHEKTLNKSNLDKHTTHKDNIDKNDIEKDTTDKKKNTEETISEEDSFAYNKQNYHASWSTQHENILIEWCDKALCYQWLHTASHISYSYKNKWFTIPVIVMSTLTGTANFAQDRIPLDLRAYYTIIIGSINIFAGILTTIQQFLKITELKEAHRVSSISWDKFYRNIKLELAKSREERMYPYQVLKISKEEFDRLMETSPSISERIIRSFYKKFSGGPIVKKGDLENNIIKFNNLHKPEVCDILETTKKTIYKVN